MKKVILFLLFIVLIVSSVYTYITSIIIIEKGEYAIIVDNNNRIIEVHSHGYKFAKQMLIPGTASVVKLKKNGYKTLKIKTFLSPLEDLNDPNLQAVLSLEIKYNINETRLDLNNFDLKKDYILDNVSEISSSLFAAEIADLSNKQYKPKILYKNWGKSEKKFFASIKDKLSNYGIELTHIKKIGRLKLPDLKTYQDGFAYKNQLDLLRKQNEISKLKFELKVKKSKLEKESYYEHLDKMSEIISKNPDVLKYIYIDKISGNVKMMAKIGDSGYPVVLESEKKSIIRKKNESEDIDNLH